MNPPKRRPRPLAPSGRAQTHQTSLSPAADAWVRSRPEGVSAYLRGLVAEDMEAQESPEDMEAAFQRFLVRLKAEDLPCAVDVVDGTA